MSGAYLLFASRVAIKRREQGLTLQALADRSGVSKSIISKIENTQVQPTIETASRIAEGLNCLLSDMLLVGKVNEVTHQLAGDQFVFDNGSHIVRGLSPAKTSVCIEIFHEHLDANTALDEKVYSSAERFILVLNSELSVTINGILYTLAEGDTLHLTNGVTHRIKNTSENNCKFITILHHNNHHK